MDRLAVQVVLSNNKIYIFFSDLILNKAVQTESKNWKMRTENWERQAYRTVAKIRAS
jgi:hypothetical protein